MTSFDRASEAETIIRFDDAADEATVYSRSRGMVGTLRRLAEAAPETVRILDAGKGRFRSMTVTLPKTWIRIEGP